MKPVIHFETTVKKRVKNVKSFLRKCSGILKDTGVPPDLTIKGIREMRLSEKSKEKIDLILTRNNKDFITDLVQVRT